MAHLIRDWKGLQLNKPWTIPYFYRLATRFLSLPSSSMSIASVPGWWCTLLWFCVRVLRVLRLPLGVALGPTPPCETLPGEESLSIDTSKGAALAEAESSIIITAWRLFAPAPRDSYPSSTVFPGPTLNRKMSELEGTVGNATRGLE